MLASSGVRILCTVFAAACCMSGVCGAHDGAAANAPLLDVLRETGSVRDGLPIYEHHPDAERYRRVLTRGMSGRLLRLYAMEQRYLEARTGAPAEPAYLLLSNRMGGFPRFGFYLGSQKKANAGYVDLSGRSRISGVFGAIDQIFPHELAHIILVQLAGPPGDGGANQIHAVGVRTDRVNAFHEGFAEHLQLLAIDDPDADPATRHLLDDDYFARRARRQIREWTSELEARWPLPGRRRAAFPAWFSQTEQALRYYAVKQNLFARQPSIPQRLLEKDLFAAYLLENTVPGGPADARKNPSQLLSTEGVVAALFTRWVTDRDVQAARRGAEFYAMYGVAADSIDGLDNAYLKLFDALFAVRPRDAAGAIAGYEVRFPDDVAALERVVQAVSLGQSFEAPPPIWLANDRFTVGTSLFDQFRGLPRVHVFDLNAASLVDLLAVPGITEARAMAIRRAAPYRELDEVARASGMDAALGRRLKQMQQRAAALRASAADEESSLSFAAVLRPYLWRIGALVLVAGVLGGVAYRLVVPCGRARAIVNGVCAATVGFALDSVLELPRGMAGLAGPLLVFGVPGALMCLAFPRRMLTRAARRPEGEPATGQRPARTRRGLALCVAFGWLLAAAPLVALMTPHF